MVFGIFYGHDVKVNKSIFQSEIHLCILKYLKLLCYKYTAKMFNFPILPRTLPYEWV